MCCVVAIHITLAPSKGRLTVSAKLSSMTSVPHYGKWESLSRPRWQRWGRRGAAGLALSRSAHALPAPTTHHACPCFALVLLQVSHTLMNLSGGRFARQELQCEWLHRAGLERGARSRIVRRHEMLPRSGKKGRSLSAAEKGGHRCARACSSAGCSRCRFLIVTLKGGDTGHCANKSNPNSFETLVPRGPGPHRTSPHKLGWGVLVSAGSQPLDAAKAKLIAGGETVSTDEEDGPNADYVREAWSRGYGLLCKLQLMHRTAACHHCNVGIITFRLPLPHKCVPLVVGGGPGKRRTVGLTQCLTCWCFIAGDGCLGCLYCKVFHQ